MAIPLPDRFPAHHPRNFWGMLTREEQSTLRTRSTASRQREGTVIVAEGAANSRVTIIRSGWAKATVIKAHRQVLLRLYGPGELIGISAALTGTAPAETVTVTCFELHAMSLPPVASLNSCAGRPMPPLPYIACNSGGWRRLTGSAPSATTPPPPRG
ncbi:hypothetical protein GCM10027612_87810 [Microbispora bryophytorum subsp. camponoti]